MWVGLFAIALTARAWIGPSGAEVGRHATEPILATANIQRALCAWRSSVLATFSMRIAIAPAHVIGRLAVCATAFGSIGTVAGHLGAARALTGCKNANISLPGPFYSPFEHGLVSEHE